MAEANYADGVGEPVDGPSTRLISNRIFNDVSQNIFSERGVTQWGFTWGQFVDHTIGLRQDSGGEDAPVGYDAADPLERFRNDFGAISFERTPAAPGTGTAGRPREQLNTLDSFIDGSAVYGNAPDRLEWLREGPVDGDLSNNSARLLLPDGLLPTVTARGDASSAPDVARQGRLQMSPDSARVAGDVRANENIALTAVQTLFALEHNRIVDQLPRWLPERTKFDIARRVVGAEEQYITYGEFLPAMGVRLDRYEGYDDGVDPTLSNEFAVVGYRAHSMVHGELEPSGPLAGYTEAQLEVIRSTGIETEVEGDEVTFVVPLGVASFNPDVLTSIGLGPVLRGLGDESQYRNDEMIDDQMRSVLFQVPRPDAEDPAACLDGESMPDCFQGVLDLAALDIERGRDHGMPSYNDLREAYGLPRRTSFTEITGESTDQFPDDPEIDADDPIDDPDILDWMELRDREGNLLEPGSEEDDAVAVSGVRRTTLAARLRAIYGDVDDVDAFVGMVSEPHVRDSDLGELQYRMWKEEFERLRDGDRFFYANDPTLDQIRNQFGIDYRHTLAQVIVANTDVDAADIEPNVFRSADDQTTEPGSGGGGRAIRTSPSPDPTRAWWWPRRISWWRSDG